MNDQRPPHGHFVCLDGLRGVAACLVLLGHVTALMQEASDTWVPRKYLAVQFFFILSGFVLAYAYEGRLRRGMGVLEFCKTRAIRLYPLIVLAAGMSAIYWTVADSSFHVNAASVVAMTLNFLCLPASGEPFSFGYFPLNPPEWSLFLELLESAFFALVFARLSSRILGLTAFACAVIYFRARLHYGIGGAPLWMETFGATMSFVLGMLLWRLNGRLPKFQTDLGVLAVILTAATIAPKWQDRPNLVIATDAVSILIGFPVIVVLGSALASRDRIARWLGGLSYPLYIIHWPIVLGVKRFILPSFGIISASIVAILASLAVASASLRFYDIPLRRWLGQKILPRATARL